MDLEEKMLTEKEQELIESRLAQIEDILREMIIIHNAHIMDVTKRKLVLTANGLDFRYQQGVLDMCEQVGMVLDGKTDYYKFTNDVRAKMVEEKTSVDVV